MKRQSNNPKNFPAWMTRGETPSVDVKGITAEAKALRNKFRSPLRFCAGGSLRRES